MRYRALLKAIPNSTDIEDWVYYKTLSDNAAVDHLRAILLSRDNILSANKIFTLYHGNHSERNLRRAAKALGIIPDKRGFGSEAITYWSLPVV